MSPKLLKPRKLAFPTLRPNRKPWFLRRGIEQLEDRLAPAAGLPPDIVVGRTLSSYSAAGVQNNTLSVTWTVYNEQAGEISGILLTDTLAPGVTIQTASQLLDQSGQNVTFSLGTLRGFERASVTLTLSSPNPLPLTVDVGAHVYGILNAGQVTNDTPAAALSSQALPADALASTSDTNTTDPFVQEQAAKLRYDPQAIFNYLNTEVGYESYAGSLRGARGTLWSAAGNSLDEASLGVALFRASGIPARYAHGTLSDPLAQDLILSMFPASYQTAGYIPEGTVTADPANDPRLLAETRDHYWLQFDTGSGYQNADSSGLSGSAIGTAFTVISDTFTEVANSLRAKTEITLTAEIYSQASAVFAGNGFSTTTVLDQTFNDVDLVGRPITVGHFVTSSALNSLTFASQTNTYTPYLILGDDAYPSDPQNQLATGSNYQEVLTNFPLGSQILTGLFLNFAVASADSITQTYTHTIFDRVGFAARQTGQSTNITADISSVSSITSLDTTTISINTATRVSANSATPNPAEGALQRLTDFAGTFTQATENVQQALLSQGISDLNVLLIGFERTEISAFESKASRATAILAGTLKVAAYLDGPRISIASTTYVNGADNSGRLALRMDLLRSAYRGSTGPGQSTDAAVAFNINRGLLENQIEGSVLPQQGQTPFTSFSVATTTSLIFDQAAQQNIATAVFGPGDAASVAALPFTADIIARIQNAILSGHTVVVPMTYVTVQGQPSIGWYQINQATGDTIGVLPDGSHGAISEWAIMQENGTSNADSPVTRFMFGFLAGALAGDEVIIARQLIAGFLINAIDNGDLNYIASVKNYFNAIRKQLEEIIELLSKSDPYFKAGFVLGSAVIFQYTVDPPLPPALIDVQPFNRSNLNSNSISVPADFPSAKAVQGTVNASSLASSGPLALSWASGPLSTFEIQTLAAGAGQIFDSNGIAIGTGQVSVSMSQQTGAVITGLATYSVQGMGSVSFYGPAEQDLGVSANWDNYSATATGNLSIKLTTDSLSLNGVPLPAGTYTISTNSATLSGSGATASPNFAGSASVSLTNGTVTLGTGTGNLAFDGLPLDPRTGTTLTGYSGSLMVTAGGGGSNSDAVVLSGTADNILRVTAPGGLTADQNTPVTFQAHVNTSFTDTYRLIAQAPVGWLVSIDNSGNITATPSPGTQSGSYPIRLVAISSANAKLVAQTTVEIAVTATSPGLAFKISGDPIFTVPYLGAEVPSAFRATLQNLGPVEDTFSLSVTNSVTGFSVITSASSVAVPAGATGVLGLYLVPDGPLPAPGTVITMTVTATSASNPAISQTQDVTFIMPEVHGLIVVTSPTSISTAPGVAVTQSLSFVNVGNVTETDITFTPTLPSGLTVTGLTSATLEPQQAFAETLTFTPDVSTQLNSNLQAVLTVTFGTVAAPQTQVVSVPIRVVVPGADAIASAAVSAANLGNTNLAARLNDLAVALTDLVQTPGSAILRSQALAALDAIIVLLQADPDTRFFVDVIANQRTVLAEATTVADVSAAVVDLGFYLQIVSTLLAEEVAHKFTLLLNPNSRVVQPLVSTTFDLIVQNLGTQSTTYDFYISGLPAGVTATFDHPSIILAPGQISDGSFGGPTISVTITSTSTTNLSSFTFTVHAQAENTANLFREATGVLTARSQYVQVASVTATPPFTNAGGVVAVQAKLLNAVNREQNAKVSYVVADSTNTVLFTSTAIDVALHVLSTLTTVDLGTFDTTGFANGNYTITATVTGTDGSPFPGATTGTTTLLIGSPVTATLTTTPDTVPAGGVSPVFNTLQINAQSLLPSVFTLQGQIAEANARSVAVLGTVAYLGALDGIHIVNVANPAQPIELSTFGSAELTGKPITGMLLNHNDELVVTAGSFTNQTLYVYSLANPLVPVLLGQTPMSYQGVPLTGVSANFIQNDHVYTAAAWYRYFIFTGQIFGQFGETLSVDISNPSTPTVVSSIYNLPPDPSLVYPDGNSFPDGTSNVRQVAAINDHTLLIATTTATHDVYSGPSVQGMVLVVDTTDPANPAVLQRLVIPGSAVITGISVSGTTATLVGSTQYWGGGIVGIIGNVVVATLDLTNPQAPTITNTTTLDANANTVGYLTDLGNGLLAVTAYGVGDPNALFPIFILDTRDPDNIRYSQFNNPSTAALAVSGGHLYAADGSTLRIYDIGIPQYIPVVAKITVPTNTVNTLSFNLQPTTTTFNGNFETLEWDLDLYTGYTSQTITFQSVVVNLNPGESRNAVQGGSVTFTSQGTVGVIPIEAQTVNGVQILALSPTTQTVPPGAPAQYTVTLINPTAYPIYYAVSLQGLPQGWIGLDSTVLVSPFSEAAVPLTLISDTFAPIGDFGFTVRAATGSISAIVEGTLTLLGDPVRPDPDSHGIVVTLTPASATTGIGSNVKYIIRLTNTGSTAERFNLATLLPAGVAGVFNTTSVLVPAGVSNFREVTLTLTPQAGTTIGTAPFTVTASSATSSVTDTANGTLDVVSNAVAVLLDHTTVNPGDLFQATITNNGNTTDTFDLTLAAPGSLVASLETSQVTLQPGESTIVNVFTGAVEFAIPGSMALTVTARSTGNPAVHASATVGILIPTTLGLTAAFQVSSQIIPIPGTADFVLLVNNTGNSEEQYSLTILGSTGPVTATLNGLNGEATETIPVFRLAALSSGTIIVHANLTATGTGTVTVLTQSLDHPAESVSQTATVGTSPPTSPPPTSPPPTSPPPTSPPPTSPPQTPILIGGSTDGKATAYLPTNGNFGPGTTLVFFPGFTGPVTTAVADVNGDGVPDYIAGSGFGLVAQVAIIDGVTGKFIAQFHTYEEYFTKGIFVGAADINGDGKADVIVTPDVGGGPVVAVYDGAKLSQGVTASQLNGQAAQINRFFGLVGEVDFRGGIRLAVADLNHDGTPDVIISAGFHGGPRIALFDGRSVATGNPMPEHLIADFFAFDNKLRGGVYVAAGDLFGNGKTELAFSGGPDDANRVRIYDAAQLLSAAPFSNLDDLPASDQLNSIATGDTSARGGARVSITPIGLLGKTTLLTASGDGQHSKIQIFQASTLLANSTITAPDEIFDPFGLTLTNGVFVS